MANNIELAEHPLFQTVFKNTRPYLKTSISKLKKLQQETGEIRITEKTPLSEYEFYNVAVFQKSGALLDGVSQLEEINKFIKRFPSPETYKKEGITQYRWIEYHYSYYIITITTLFDHSLFLTNVVFRLGIPERFCKARLIKSIEWIKESRAIKKIRSLEKIIERHRKTRNSYIHRGKTPDLHAIFQSEFLDYLKLINLADPALETAVDKQILDSAYKFETSKICGKLDKEIQELKKAIYKLFDSLLPVYESVVKTLQS
jgi:hypothetical protein